MKLKLELWRKSGSTSDVVITVEPHVTVGDIAAALAQRDPEAGQIRRPSHATLALHADAGPRPIPSELSLLDAGIRSGSTVEIVDDDVSIGVRRSGPVAAKLRVLAGPDAGAEFDVPVGTSYVGRDASCEIRLRDPLISKQHAKLHVTSVPELVDTNSSNGILIGEEQVSRIVLRPDDVAVLGESAIAVSMVGNSSDHNHIHGTAIPFIRSPRVSPRFDADEIESPDLPEPLDPPRVSIAALVIPIVLGAVLYLITRQVVTIAFVALSPLMMLGTYVEGSTTRRRSHEKNLTEFRSQLAAMDQELERRLADERRIRLSENPSSADVAAAIDGLQPLTWTRRPDQVEFLQVRLGLGTQASRTVVKLPENARRGGEGLSEVLDLAARYATVSDVPVIADLKGPRSLGIAGDDEVARDLARCVMAQVVGLHSPAEVVVAAVASAQSATNWDWLKWTPHLSSPNSPLANSQLAVGRGACLNLVAEIEALIVQRRDAERHSDPDLDELPVRILLLVEDDAAIERSRLVAIAEEGWKAYVSVVWCAPSIEQLPSACRTYLESNRSSGSTQAVYVDSRSRVNLTEIERIDRTTSLRIARRLAPMVDVGIGVDDESDLPASISWVQLAGTSALESPQAVLERWAESNSVVNRNPGATRRRLKESGLRALIGQTATDALYLDLRAHGPHALVGGTTGAGKSELLQSWILALASAYSPDRLTFLLVDYKGGSAFGDCKDLPHTVGIVTDLTVHLARRALVSLLAELRYRERLLNRKRAKDLIELERRDDPEAPPSLVIVIDEFAALVQELPEFIDGIVNVAQRGRSLGLHLVLATQRPAGVIKDNLRANTNLRIALRMADEVDSEDVLGSPVAASFDPALPGRASAKLGPGRLVAFQAAYAGGTTSDSPEPPSIVIEDLVFGIQRAWEEDVVPVADEAMVSQPRDIERIVRTIRAAANLGEIPIPRKSWLNELARIYELRRLPTPRKDTEIVFGVLDNPEEQQQPIAAFHPERDGNLAIYGTGGSGKSTALRTLAISAGFNARGGNCHVYGLDFGSKGLDMLKELPHVGAIIDGDDDELVIRLLRTVRAEIDRRATAYAEFKVGSLSEYRERARRPDEPRILLLVDAVGGLRQAYEGNEKSKWLDLFVSIAQEGRSVGVHVVLTADRPAALTSSLASSMQRRIVLRLSSESDMAILGIPPGVITAASPPGRGYSDERELQFAVFGGSSNIAEQAAAIGRLAAAMRKNDVAEAPPIERLKEQVFLGDLPVSVGEFPTIGISGDSLGPIGIAHSGTFVVAGPPSSGRTTALATLVVSLRRWSSQAHLYYFAQRNGSLTGLLDWSTVALGPDEVAEAATELTESVASGAFTGRPLAVVIESVAEFLNTAADQPLQGLAKALLEARLLLVADGDPATLSGSWPLLQAVRLSRRGIALQPDQSEGLALFKTPFPRVNRADFPPGRCLLVLNGRTEVVQLALPE